MLPKYTEQFSKIISRVIELEGGLADNPKDPGGLTLYGISQRAFPWLDIRNLTKEDAEQIYFWYYWMPMKAYLVPDHLRFAVFDFAINAGIKTAVKSLQKLAGVKQDGIMGPGTASLSKSVTLNAYLSERERYYRSLKNAKHFLPMWLIRLRHVREWAAEMLK